mmetsp:Transcript_46987/g.130894  ORF Transcript_46987/g.130894 Transcript_46987/m.130894 type:complete len:474 (+) Transcript_46987:999-2420(+)
MRCKSSSGLKPATAESGSNGNPSKETFRCVHSKHSSLRGCSSEQMSKYLLKSRAPLVERATARMPGASAPMAPRIPMTSADVFPHCGPPWTVIKLFCSSLKADITNGMTRRCISRGLSKPYCLKSCCICSAYFVPSLVKSCWKSLTTSMCMRPSPWNSENTSIWLPSNTVSFESRCCLSSVEAESLLRVDSEIVDKKLSSRLPLRRDCLGCRMCNRGFGRCFEPPAELPMLACEEFVGLVVSGTTPQKSPDADDIVVVTVGTGAATGVGCATSNGLTGERSSFAAGEENIASPSPPPPLASPPVMPAPEFFRRSGLRGATVTVGESGGVEAAEAMGPVGVNARPTCGRGLRPPAPLGAVGNEGVVGGGASSLSSVPDHPARDNGSPLPPASSADSLLPPWLPAQPMANPASGPGRHRSEERTPVGVLLPLGARLEGLSGVVAPLDGPALLRLRCRPVAVNAAAVAEEHGASGV